jgi:hypothetical protein
MQGTKDMNDAMARLGIPDLDQTMFRDCGDCSEQNAGRTYTHMNQTHEISGGRYSDASVAHSVRMLMRDDWHHEAKVVMARDRILCLAAENAALKRNLDGRDKFIVSKDLWGEFVAQLPPLNTAPETDKS